MSNSLEIREATAADAEALSALVNSAYRGESSKRGWTTEADLLGGQRTDPQLLAAEINEPSRTMLLALADGELIGCVSVTRVHDHCHLGMLTIKPELQSVGLGKRLVRAAEQRARAWGFSKMTLNVIQARESLIAWYERQGYARTEIVEPFPYGDERFGLPKVEGLSFRLFEKDLSSPSESPSAHPAHS